MKSDPPGSIAGHPRSNRLRVAAVVAFLMVTFATGYRVVHRHYPGPGHSRDQGMGFCDFYNGIYYPTKAFFATDNPYSAEYVGEYPVSRQVPLFSPLVFMIHWPFALLDGRAAAVAYFGWLMFVTFALATLALKIADRRITTTAVLAVTAYVLFTRGGQVTFYNGYFTFELVIGAVVALHFGDRKPGLAGVGLALASCKPTYAIPLAILMLSKRDFKATLIGVGLSALFMAVGIGWMSLSDSVLHVIQVLGQSQQAHGEFPDLWPVNTCTRIDLLAIVSKWFGWRPHDSSTLTVMLGLLALPCALLWKLTHSDARRFDQGAAGIVGLVCILSMLLCVYHHFYDAIILIVPSLAMVFTPKSDWKRIGRIHRYVIVGLINVPLLNYFSARMVIGFSGLEPLMPAHVWITSINTVCLTIALLYCFVLVHAASPAPRTNAMLRSESA